MRTDKKKNIDKVAASLAKNPLQTEREIAEKTGLGNGTVNRAKKKLEQNGAKDHRIVHLTNDDFNIILKINEIKKKRLMNSPDKINNSDVDLWQRTAEKRYQIFRGEITDEQGGLKDISNLSIDELIKILNDK